MIAAVLQHKSHTLYELTIALVQRPDNKYYRSCVLKSQTLLVRRFVQREFKKQHPLEDHTTASKTVLVWLLVLRIAFVQNRLNLLEQFLYYFKQACFTPTYVLLKKYNISALHSSNSKYLFESFVFKSSNTYFKDIPDVNKQVHCSQIRRVQ